MCNGVNVVPIYSLTNHNGVQEAEGAGTSHVASSQRISDRGIKTLQTDTEWIEEFAIRLLIYKSWETIAGGPEGAAGAGRQW